MNPTFTLRTYLKNVAIVLLLCLNFNVYAQRPSGQGGGDRSSWNVGRFYGKVVDEKGKGIGFATVQLFGKRFNKETKSVEEGLIAGQITEDNGDFSLEKLPTKGKFTLKISVLGYATTETEVSFGGSEDGQKRPTAPGQGNSSQWGGGMAGKFDKDLGNITLSTEAQTLDEVVVKGEAANVQLALDRKIFKVDKDASATGGTAEDALRNVPSLSIDLDGNLTLRNAAPQLFVDGRPTTLTLDQIAADEIESIEVITNPSAKYEASGGQAGIVNIVLKKERRLGYNGNLRAGIDSQTGANLGGNINLREGKVNVFLSGNYFGRNRTGENETDRQNLFGEPNTNILQLGEDESTGFFSSIRGGLDWFINNRSTITFEGSYRLGNFDSENLLSTQTDSLFDELSMSQSIRDTESERTFGGVRGGVLFKHLFPKEGKEWTADVTYAQFDFDNLSNFETSFSNTNVNSLEKQEGEGSTTFITLQTDYVEPIGESAKLEIGARATFREQENNNANLVFDEDSGAFVRIPNFADVYEYTDDVIAGYVTFSKQIDQWGFMGGLRAESSQYTGTLPEGDQTFENDFPLSLFPSAFVTYNINESDNIQMSYSRRINRPGFFNLIPFTDFSDSLNLRRGNPDLVPEFTNAFEITYQNIFEKGDNVLISAYVKSASNLITTFQTTEFDADLDREVVIQTFENANSSIAYGAEFTVRNSFLKHFELVSNLNLYNSRVDASNVEEDLINNQFTWFLKENLKINIPKIFTVQIDAQYQSRAAFSPSNNNGRFRHWRRATNTAQGYTLAYWFANVSLRKSIMKRKMTLTLSVSDIFRTRETGTHSESDLFIQDTWRIRNPQLVRLNVSYRFGKPDVSLFKRKNNNRGSEGSDLMN